MDLWAQRFASALLRRHAPPLLGWNLQGHTDARTLRRYAPHEGGCRKRSRRLRPHLCCRYLQADSSHADRGYGSLSAQGIRSDASAGTVGYGSGAAIQSEGDWTARIAV